MKRSTLYGAINILLRQKNTLIKKSVSETHFSSNICPSSKITELTKFSKVQLPFPVKGVLITSGSYKDSRFGKIILTEEDLKKSADLWVGVNIFKQHGVYEAAFLEGRDVPIDMVVGKITNAFWNDRKKRLEYEGEIDDENIAFKIARGLIKHVSITFTQDRVKLGDGYRLKNIKPIDLSLVFNPRDKNASIEPKNAN